MSRSEVVGQMLGLLSTAIFFGVFIYYGVFTQDTHELCFFGFLIVISMIKLIQHQEVLKKKIEKMAEEMTEEEKK